MKHAPSGGERGDMEIGGRRRDPISSQRLPLLWGRTASPLLTDRDLFTAALFNGPILPADAIVVLTGDGNERVSTTYGLLMQGAAHYVVLTGGIHDPPYCRDAEHLGGILIEKGLAPGRMLVDNDSMNTRESAEWVVEHARKEGWGRIILVTSPYHTPRAVLTFVRSLLDRDATDKLHVLPVPAAHLPWWESVDGPGETRAVLYEGEARKIQQYGEQGHVATYAEGIEYLRHWEGK